MLSCAFFGQKRFDYSPYSQKIESVIAELIVEHGVRDFFVSGDSPFDYMCANIIQSFKSKYPDIVVTLIANRFPDRYFNMHKYIDDAVYSYDTPEIPEFADDYITKQMTDMADIIVSGLEKNSETQAYNYAKKCKKKIINILED